MSVASITITDSETVTTITVTDGASTDYVDTSVATKANIASPTFTGTVTMPGATVTADLTLDNDIAYRVKESGGTARDVLTINSSDVVKVGNTISAPMLIDSGSYVQIRSNGGFPVLICSTDGTARFYDALTVDGNLDLDGLPTSDPSHAGRVWNDSGTLKISAG